MPEQEYLRVYGKNREQMVKETQTELRSAMKKKDKALAKALFEKLKKVYIGDDIFWANEVGTNIFVATIMGLFCIILLVTMVLSEVGVYKFNNDVLVPTINIINAFLFLGMILCFVFKGEKHWIKYMMMVMLCIVIGALVSFLGYRAVISLSIPVVISSKYLSEAFTKFISVVSGICMFVGTLLSAFLGLSVDLNFVSLKSDVSLVFDSAIKNNIARDQIAMNDYITNLMLRGFLPNFLQFLLICYICCILAKWGHKTIIDQAETTKEFARVDTELNLAKDIQTNILPSIFPPFPDKPEVDIYATMNAAKEVGGDFYDFFLVDDNHLAIVVADVSDKGVPAALFMMIGKALIKSQTMLKKGPAEVLEIVNNQLCENNEVGLFITAWIGILDIRTGEIIASNAGHEYPAVATKDGYSFIKHKAGFVLAGVEDMTYEEYKIQLEPGDSIFLYTDGVTEATNEEEQLFGKDRVLEVLNRHIKDDQKELLHAVRAEIDAFVGKASQHDDITMIGLNYRGTEK